MTNEEDSGRRGVWLVPSLATLLVLACGLFPFVLMTSSGGGSMEFELGGAPGPTIQTYRLGPGLALFRTEVAGGVVNETVSIGWLRIVVLLAVAYPVAALVVHRVRGLVPPRVARLVLVGAPLCIVAGAVLCGGLASRALWGYWFAPPAAEAVTQHLTTATHAAVVSNASDSPGDPTGLPLLPTEQVDLATRGTGDELDGRIARALEAAGVEFTNLPRPSAADLERLRSFLFAGDVLPVAEVGYEARANRLGGLVVLGTDADGRPVLVVELRTGEVSNDHRAQVELALDWPAQGAPTVRARNAVFYDVAGLEGITWAGVASVLGMLGGLALSLIVGVMAVLPRRVPGAPLPAETP